MPGPKLAAVALLLLGGLGGAPDASAQIVREKPAQIKAANRRALREARSTESPYKESHLSVTPAHLKRGSSTQAVVEEKDKEKEKLDYKNGTAPNVKPLGLLGSRRNKASTIVREERREAPKKTAKAPAQKKN